MIKIYFRLTVKRRSFAKVVAVEAVPSKGSLLKVANNSFVVEEHEQDLDAYEERDHENSQFCNSVKANLNEDCAYTEENYPGIIKDLLDAGWGEIHF